MSFLLLCTKQRKYCLYVFLPTMEVVTGKKRKRKKVLYDCSVHAFRIHFCRYTKYGTLANKAIFFFFFSSTAAFKFFTNFFISDKFFVFRKKNNAFCNEVNPDMKWSKKVVFYIKWLTIIVWISFIILNCFSRPNFSAATTTAVYLFHLLLYEFTFDCWQSFICVYT